jgi:hypothetical protein
VTAINHIRARLQHHSLDRQIAGGAELADPLLTERARQLIRPRMRARVASDIERLVADTHRRDPRLTAAVPVCRHAIREARPDLIGLASSLRAPDASSPKGVARALILLSDDEGPVFNPRCDHSLRTEVQAAETALFLGPRLQS